MAGVGTTEALELTGLTTLARIEDEEVAGRVTVLLSVTVAVDVDVEVEVEVDTLEEELIVIVLELRVRVIVCRSVLVEVCVM